MRSFQSLTTCSDHCSLLVINTNEKAKRPIRLIKNVKLHKDKPKPKTKLNNVKVHYNVKGVLPVNVKYKKGLS